jgi:hypothetical protein
VTERSDETRGRLDVAPLGRHVAARRLALARAGAAGMAARVAERRRPKLLYAATRLVPRRALGSRDEEEAAAPPMPEIDGVSDDAARWLFHGELPEDLVPFLGGTPVAPPGDPTPGASPPNPTPGGSERPRRRVPRGKVEEGPARAPVAREAAALEPAAPERAGPDPVPPPFDAPEPGEPARPRRARDGEERAVAPASPTAARSRPVRLARVPRGGPGPAEARPVAADRQAPPDAPVRDDAGDPPSADAPERGPSDETEPEDPEIAMPGAQRSTPVRLARKPATRSRAVSAEPGPSQPPAGAADASDAPVVAEASGSAPTSDTPEHRVPEERQGSDPRRPHGREGAQPGRAGLSRVSRKRVEDVVAPAGREPGAQPTARAADAPDAPVPPEDPGSRVTSDTPEQRVSEERSDPGTLHPDDLTDAPPRRTGPPRVSRKRVEDVVAPPRHEPGAPPPARPADAPAGAEASGPPVTSDAPEQRASGEGRDSGPRRATVRASAPARRAERRRLSRERTEDVVAPPATAPVRGPGAAPVPDTPLEPPVQERWPETGSARAKDTAGTAPAGESGGATSSRGAAAPQRATLRRAVRARAPEEPDSPAPSSPTARSAPEASQAKPAAEARRDAVRSEAPRRTAARVSPAAAPGLAAAEGTARSEAPRRTAAAEVSQAEPGAEAPRATPGAEARLGTPGAEAPRRTAARVSPAPAPGPEAAEGTARSEAPRRMAAPEASQAEPGAEAPRATPGAEARLGTPRPEAPRRTAARVSPAAAPGPEAAERTARPEAVRLRPAPREPRREAPGPEGPQRAGAREARDDQGSAASPASAEAGEPTAPPVSPGSASGPQDRAVSRPRPVVAEAPATPEEAGRPGHAAARRGSPSRVAPRPAPALTPAMRKAAGPETPADAPATAESGPSPATVEAPTPEAEQAAHGTHAAARPLPGSPAKTRVSAPASTPIPGPKSSERKRDRAAAAPAAIGATTRSQPRAERPVMQRAPRAVGAVGGAPATASVARDERRMVPRAGAARPRVALRSPAPRPAGPPVELAPPRHGKRLRRVAALAGGEYSDDGLAATITFPQAAAAAAAAAPAGPVLARAPVGAAPGAEATPALAPAPAPAPPAPRPEELDLDAVYEHVASRIRRELLHERERIGDLAGDLPGLEAPR